MRKTLCLVLAILMICGVFPAYCFAAETNVETIYFDDGSYMTVEIRQDKGRASGSITGSKTNTYYGSSGDTQWKATLTGSFTYTGSGATCTSSSADVTIYDSGWYIYSKYATKSANAAKASITMVKKVSGVTVSNVPFDMTLTCDANGNLS